MSDLTALRGGRGRFRRWRMPDLKKFSAELYAVSQMLPPEERARFVEGRIAYLERDFVAADSFRRRRGSKN